jgi:uncharacterized protein (DUF2235 family)
MGRKIILLSDGTGNSSAKVWRTNVWRVFESLDLTGSGQVAFYDDGVGTSSFKPLAILGGGFGYGLKRNVIDIYKFACRNWRSDDDEIFGFGFSRGAFTMRIVMGLILEQGIIRADNEAELDRRAHAAYREFRKNFSTTFQVERIVRWVRDSFRRTKYSKEDNFHGATIRFVGLWDTVAAYGMPIDEMTKGISDWIFPLLLPDHKLNPRVRRACHALSIDDERTTFHPVLWDESDERPLAPRPDGTLHLADERISQVWFAGVHSNVGGGYPDDSLAHIPLIWIMNEAAAAGLTFKSMPVASPQSIAHAPTVEDKDGRIYDPRSGLGGYYRYGPRNIAELGKELLSRHGGKAAPKIHESVLRRIVNKAHLYTPNGIPAEYHVINSAGQILLPAANPYENPAQATARANLQEVAWNTIWWRRIVYFITVGVSAYLAIFPLMKAAPSTDELESKLRWISDIVRLVGAFLPGAADPWINGYARAPLHFLLVIFVLIGCLKWGSVLADRIQNTMEKNWANSLAGQLGATGKPNDWVYWLRTSRWYRSTHRWVKVTAAPALFALLFVYLGLAFMSHGVFNIQDYAGMVCKDVANPRQMAPGETITIKGGDIFDAKSLCQNLNVNVEQYGKYRIKVTFTEPFRDGGIAIDASRGFYVGDVPTLWQQAIMLAALPLRRELIRPWFRMVARIGETGGEETFLDPDPNDGSIVEVVSATRNGQLFLFVNDAVLPIPSLYDFFYRNNVGTAEIAITRQKSCFVCT